MCIFCLVSILLILSYPATDSRAGIERFDIQLQSGFFVPDNPAIIGTKTAHYSYSGQLDGFYARGFGYGYDIIFMADSEIFDWIIRVDLGRRHLYNGPDKSEKADLDSYYEGTMTIYPVILDLIRKIEIPRAKTIPYAGAGIGVNIVDWNESRINKNPNYSPRYFTKGTKGSIAYQFLAGCKIGMYKNLSVSLEYSYCFVPAKINIAWYYDLRGANKANVGGSSFRLGMVYSL